MASDVTVFVDESGDSNLNTILEGTTNLYTIVGVIVPTESRGEFDRIHSELFGVTELKSSSLRPERRRRKIAMLSELPFKFSALVIDKAAIGKESGLSYKRSFIKYMHRKIFDRFDRAYSGVTIVADQHGTNDFMAQCKRYYEQKYTKPMQHYISLPIEPRFNFMFGDSKEWRGIQVADLIAGSVRRLYENQDDDVLGPIRSKQLAIEVWPKQIASSVSDSRLDTYDDLIKDVSVKSVLNFLRDNDQSDDETIQIQVDTLGYLLDKFSDDPNHFVATKEIVRYLTEYQGYSEIGEQKFRNIIGLLRSEGVAVVSANSGYKIPNSHADVQLFITKVLSIVDPYISRLGRFRDLLIEASHGEYDIFKAEGVEANELDRVSKYLGN